MKKYLSLFSLFVITLLLLSLSACDSSGSITTTGSAPITTTITITQIITVTSEPTPSSAHEMEGRKDAEIELANVQTAVVAAMADAVTNAVAAPGPFGNTSKAMSKPFTGIDVTVSGDYTVGDYIAGGAANVVGSYIIAVDGKVTQVWYASLVPTPTPKTSIVQDRKDAETELANVQTAVTAAMADAVTNVVAQGGTTENFGNTNHSMSKPFTGTDCTVSDGYAVGDYIAGGAANVVGSYIIAVDGRVTQVWYP